MECSTMPTETQKKSKTFEYEVTFHLPEGKFVTVECKNELYDKQNFAENLCRCNYAILEGGNICINIQRVTYIEVKEITNGN